MNHLPPTLLLSVTLVILTFTAPAQKQKRSASAAPPLLALLDQFTGPNVPPIGPAEAATERNWPEPTSVPELVGHGIAEHPMLYAGEGHNTIFIVNHGKVIWTYSTGK